MRIELINNETNLLERGIDYFYKKWGSKTNFNFYKDCIENSIRDAVSLPKFYLMLNKDEIIGCYALLTNDIISRQDLIPWFACLYVEEQYRNLGLAEKLLSHSLETSKNKGYDMLYLSTELNDFYEKKGWNYYSNGFGVFGNELKIYAIQTT